LEDGSPVEEGVGAACAEEGTDEDGGKEGGIADFGGSVELGSPDESEGCKG